MTRARGLALLAAAVAACSGGGGGNDQPPARPRAAQPQGVVIGAGNASAPGGHRVVGGIVGGATEVKSTQFQARGGIQP